MVSKFDAEKFYSEFCSEIYYKIIDTIEDGFDIYRNLIDPFTTLLVIETQEITKEEWLEKEKNRQIEKIIEGLVGTLHEIAIGCFEDWDRLTKPEPDCVNVKGKKLIECKNKYITMKQGQLKSYYKNLENKLKEKKYKGYTAYLVNILPDYSNKKPINKVWKPHPDIKTREDIRIIDGKSFYTLISGDEDFLKKLLTEYVPEAIKRCNMHVPQNSSDSNIMDLIGELYDKTFILDFDDLTNLDLQKMYENEPAEFKQKLDSEILTKRSAYSYFQTKNKGVKEKPEWKDEKERYEKIRENEFAKLKMMIQSKYSSMQEYIEHNPNII